MEGLERMINLFAGLGLGLVIGIGTGMAIQRHYEVKFTPKPPCVGYTKIEYGKAVDCYGDTIRIKEHNELYREYLEKMKQQGQ